MVPVLNIKMIAAASLPRFALCQRPALGALIGASPETYSRRPYTCAGTATPAPLAAPVFTPDPFLITANVSHPPPPSPAPPPPPSPPPPPPPSPPPSPPGPPPPSPPAPPPPPSTETALLSVIALVGQELPPFNGAQQVSPSTVVCIAPTALMIRLLSSSRLINHWPILRVLIYHGLNCFCQVLLIKALSGTMPVLKTKNVAISKVSFTL